MVGGGGEGTKRRGDEMMKRGGGVRGEWRETKGKADIPGKTYMPDLNRGRMPAPPAGVRDSQFLTALRSGGRQRLGLDGGGIQ